MKKANEWWGFLSDGTILWTKADCSISRQDISNTGSGYIAVKPFVFLKVPLMQNAWVSVHENSYMLPSGKFGVIILSGFLLPLNIRQSLILVPNCFCVATFSLKATFWYTHQWP